MYKKDVILFVSIFCVLALVAGGTYAYWGWSSGLENKIVVFNTSKGIQEYITYNAGTSYFVGDFQPSSTHCGGKSNTLSFSKKSAVASETLTATIKMDVNHIGANAKSSNVKWAITSGAASACSTTTLATGNFSGYSSGGSYTLLSDQEITTSTKTYTVWVWIDQNGSNLGALSGNTIDVNIWTQIDMTSSD